MYGVRVKGMEGGQEELRRRGRERDSGGKVLVHSATAISGCLPGLHGVRHRVVTIRLNFQTSSSCSGTPSQEQHSLRLLCVGHVAHRR